MPLIRKQIPGCHEGEGRDYIGTAGFERYFVAADPASARDHFALAFLHVKQEPELTWGPDGRQLLGPVFKRIVRIERLIQHSNYVDMARYVKSLLMHPALLGDVTLCVDATGVGRALCDILTAEHVAHTRIVMTSSDSYKRIAHDQFNVGKSYLLSTMAAQIENSIVQIVADGPGCSILLDEMQNFELTVNERSQRESVNAAIGHHDDAIIAAALAIFMADMGSFQASFNNRITGWL